MSVRSFRARDRSQDLLDQILSRIGLPPMTRIERRAVVIEAHPHHRRSRQLPQKPAEEKFALGSLAFDLGDDDVRRRFPDSVERLLLLHCDAHHLYALLL